MLEAREMSKEKKEMDREKETDREKALGKIDKWFGTMVLMCILFAVVTFIIWIMTRDSGDDVYAARIACFWASFALTIFFGVIAATVKKIYKYLALALVADGK